MNSELTASIVEAVGWALVHFLWQGIAIAILLWGFLSLARHASPQIRYVASATAMLFMVSAFVASLVICWDAPEPPPSGMPSEGMTRVNDVPHVVPARTNNVVEMAIGRPSETLKVPASEPSSSVATEPVIPPVVTVSISERVRARLPWAVGIWAIGVLVFSLRFAFAWRAVLRWKRSGSAGLPDAWSARFAALCHRLGVTKSVRLLSSSLVNVPVVIGWLKPVVLVPAGLFTGLSAAQLEAILAHELAHVMRRDYLTNLIQNVVETLFFYHPAVWWVSARMRKEREFCCDDVAAKLSGNSLDYAKALTSLEELRGASVLGVSAAGSPLVQRIRRIVGLPEERAKISPLAILMMGGLLCVILVGLKTNLNATPPLQLEKAEISGVQESGKRDVDVDATADYRKAYLKFDAGIHLIQERKFHEAVTKLLEALTDFETIQKNFPTWNSEMVAYRIKRTEEVIEKVIDEEAHRGNFPEAQSDRDAEVNLRLRNSILSAQTRLISAQRNWTELGEFDVEEYQAARLDLEILVQELESEIKKLNVESSSNVQPGAKPETGMSKRNDAVIQQQLTQADKTMDLLLNGIDQSQDRRNPKRQNHLISSHYGGFNFLDQPHADRKSMVFDLSISQKPVGLGLDFSGSLKDLGLSNPFDQDSPVTDETKNPEDEKSKVPSDKIDTQSIEQTPSFGWDQKILNDTGWQVTSGEGEKRISDRLRLRVSQVKSPDSIPKNQLEVWWGGPGEMVTTRTIDLLRGSAVPSLIYKHEGDAIWIEEAAFGIESIGMRKIDLSMPGVAKETYWPATRNQLQGIRGQLWRESGDFGGLAGWGLQWVAMRARACHAAMGPRLRSISQKAKIDSPVYQADVSKMEAIESSGKWMIRLDLSQTGQTRLERLRQLHGDSLLVVLAAGTKHCPLPANLNHLILESDFTETEAKKLVAWMKLSLPGDYPSGSFVISKPADEIANSDDSTRKEPRPIHPSAPNPATSGYRVNVHDTHTHLEVKTFRVIAGVRSSVSPEFEKKQGKPVVVWQPHTLREGKDGVLDWPMEKAYEEMALRVEADGYEPQFLTWVEKKNGAQDIVFNLKPAEAYSVQVVKPDGKPAAGATVALAMVQRDVRVAGGLIVQPDPAQVKSASDQWRLPRMFTVDGAGKLQLPSENDPTAAVLICHEDGVLDLSLRDLQGTHEVKLKPWGKIEGQVQWGRIVGGNRRVTLSVDHGDSYGYPGIVAQFEETKTDQNGAFVFDRVIPGMCQLSCPIQAKSPKEGGITEINLSGQLTHADVKSGPAGTVVIIGGQGRTVKGKLTGRDEWVGVILHLRPTVPHVGFPGDEELWSAWGELQQSELGPMFFKGGLNVNADGTFEIPAVLPGSYQLFFSRNNGNDQVATGQIQVDPEIPGVETVPLELGEMKAK